MTTITTDDIAGKKDELAKKIKQYEEKVSQWKKEIEALEITERLLSGNSETVFDKRRKEMGDAVMRALPDFEPVHSKIIAERVSADLGKEVKPNAMYNFLNRAIDRGDLPIEKKEEGKYVRAKGPGNADGVSTSVDVQS